MKTAKTIQEHLVNSAERRFSFVRSGRTDFRAPGTASSQPLELITARRLLISVCMKSFREYARVFSVYMSFAVFVAAEAAVIIFLYRHLGIM